MGSWVTRCLFALYWTCVSTAREGGNQEEILKSSSLKKETIRVEGFSGPRDRSEGVWFCCLLASRGTQVLWVQSTFCESICKTGTERWHCSDGTELAKQKSTSLNRNKTNTVGHSCMKLSGQVRHKLKFICTKYGWRKDCY